MSYPILIIVFSLAVLGVSAVADLELLRSASPAPLQTLYATLLTLVGILGVFVAIALVAMTKRLDRLERAARDRPV